MSKSYKKDRDKKTGQFVTVKETEKRPSKAIVKTVKVEQSVKPPAKRTIKAAPKIGKISSSSIKEAVKAVSSARKKK